MKETQREQQLLVFVLLVAAVELLLCDQLVQALHVCLQTLWRHVTAKVRHQSDSIDHSCFYHTYFDYNELYNNRKRTKKKRKGTEEKKD